MKPKAKLYIPHVFRSFQGFDVIDLKEYRLRQHLEIVLEKSPQRTHVCWRCDTVLGSMKDRYLVQAKHLRMMSWTVSVVFYREKRHCPSCKKTRSEKIEFLCPSSPHVTMELAWWLNRLTEITSVLSVSKLQSVDKETCYQVDKFILSHLHWRTGIYFVN